MLRADVISIGFEFFISVKKVMVILKRSSLFLLNLDLFVFDGDSLGFNEPLDLEIFNRNDLVHAIPKGDDILPRIIMIVLVLDCFKDAACLVNRLDAGVSFDSRSLGDNQLGDVFGGGSFHGA